MNTSAKGSNLGNGKFRNRVARYIDKTINVAPSTVCELKRNIVYLIASSPARIENYLFSLHRVCSRQHVIFYSNRTDLDADVTLVFKTRLKVQLIYIGILRDIGVRKLLFTALFRSLSLPRSSKVRKTIVIQHL